MEVKATDTGASVYGFTLCSLAVFRTWLKVFGRVFIYQSNVSVPVITDKIFSLQDSFKRLCF